MLFARNRLCALVKPGLAVTPETLLERMLDPAVKLGTSTPKADPSGDYAFEVFAKADALKAGANDALAKKALQLTGGPNSPPPPKDRSVYGKVVADGQADIFLTYCTNAIVAQRENPGQQVVRVAGRARGRRGLRDDGDQRRVAGVRTLRCVHTVSGRTGHSREARVHGVVAALTRELQAGVSQAVDPVSCVASSLKHSRLRYIAGHAMKLSARNRIKGKIVDVKKGATTAHVKIDVGGGQIVTSAITNEAVDELGLAPGKTAYAVIKASDVMIGVD